MERPVVNTMPTGLRMTAVGDKPALPWNYVEAFPQAARGGWSIRVAADQVPPAKFTAKPFVKRHSPFIFAAWLRQS
jgi:hypothetical protein